jgi:hypothetical protein
VKEIDQQRKLLLMIRRHPFLAMRRLIPERAVVDSLLADAQPSSLPQCSCRASEKGDAGQSRDLAEY